MTDILDKIRNHCVNYKKIQDYVLTYFNDNNSNDQTNLTKLFQEIDQNICKNEELFDEFLRMLASIASTNCHINNFYPKLFRIINEYKNTIKSNYSNEEIFSIFLHNEPVILFLSKEKIFQFDDDLKYLINNVDHQEQREYFFSTEDEDERDQEEGQNHTKICKIIRSDQLQDFISHIDQNNVPLESNISPSKFETNYFLRDKEISLIQYAAFYGSIQIFNYIIEKHPTLLNENTWEFAFLSHNKEILNIIENHNVSPPSDNFESCLLMAIKSLQNDNYTAILNKFAQEPSVDINNPRPPPKHGNPYLYEAVMSFNYTIIVDLINEIDANNLYNMIFQRACKVGLISIPKFLINFPQIQINKCGNYSALQKACIINNLYLVKILLKSPNIDVNLQSRSFLDDITHYYDGLTALEYAIKYGHNRIVEYLLSIDGIDLNKKSRWRGSRPLHVAAQFNNVHATKLLLSFNGIEVNALSHDEYKINKNLALTGGRESALHLACKNNFIEIVKLLLERPDVDTEIENWENKKAIDLTDDEEIKDLFKTK